MDANEQEIRRQERAAMADFLRRCAKAALDPVKSADVIIALNSAATCCEKGHHWPTPSSPPTATTKDRK